MNMDTARVVICIEGRMTSVRLPGKILKPCLGKPMLERLIERARRVQGVDSLVVATTTNAAKRPTPMIGLR